MTVKWLKSEKIHKIVGIDRNVPLTYIYDASLNIDLSIRYNGNSVDIDHFGIPFNFKSTNHDLSDEDDACDEEIDDEYGDDDLNDLEVYTQESYITNKCRRKAELIDQLKQELKEKERTPANREYITCFFG